MRNVWRLVSQLCKDDAEQIALKVLDFSKCKHGKFSDKTGKCFHKSRNREHRGEKSYKNTPKALRQEIGRGKIRLSKGPFVVKWRDKYKIQKVDGSYPKQVIEQVIADSKGMDPAEVYEKFRKGQIQKGFARQLETDKNIQKSIASSLKTIQQHYDKIRNPQMYIDHPAGQEQIAWTVQHWFQDIKRNTQQYLIRKKYLEEHSNERSD